MDLLSTRVLDTSHIFTDSPINFELIHKFKQREIPDLKLYFISSILETSSSFQNIYDMENISLQDRELTNTNFSNGDLKNTDSFDTDSFDTDSFDTDSFDTDSFDTDSFDTDSFDTDSDYNSNNIKEETLFQQKNIFLIILQINFQKNYYLMTINNKL